MDWKQNHRYTVLDIPDDLQCNSNGSGKPPRMGLLEKLSAAYRESPYDPISSGYASLFSMTYFWFINISGLYLMLEHVIPEQYAHWEPMHRYYLKVGSCFLFCQISVNFVCVRFYDSFWIWTEDRPRHVAEQLRENKRYARLNHCTIEVKDDTIGGPPKYCRDCKQDKPYRTHHCFICKKCILKRDHHCFFTGTCIGHFNQRYFIVMNFYVAFSCAWGMFELCHFLANEPQNRDSWHYFLPLTCYRWLVGTVSFRDMLVMFHVYGLWWIGLTAICFFLWNFFIVLIGKTSYEVQHGIKVRSTASIPERLRSVFSDFWLANFLFPAVLIFRQQSDGICWPELKLSYLRNIRVINSAGMK